MKQNKLLWDLYHHLNHTYFNNSIYVQEIKYGKFMKDAFMGGITFGCFVYEKNKQNTIVVNSYLLMPWLVERYPWLSEIVMFHEMAHAFLILNKYQERFGQYTCEDHGPEFYRVMDQHPMSKRSEKIINSDHPVTDMILKEIRHDAEKYLEKNAGRNLTIKQ